MFFGGGAIFGSNARGVRLPGRRPVGEPVDVDGSLRSNDVCSGSFFLNYDADALQLVETRASSALQCLVNPDRRQWPLCASLEQKL